MPMVDEFFLHVDTQAAAEINSNFHASHMEYVKLKRSIFRLQYLLWYLICDDTSMHHPDTCTIHVKTKLFLYHQT